MPKQRLGVVLLIPSPVAAEVDGLRRALGSTSIDRIPPHITLVPPVNVNDERLDGALALVRRTAGTTEPLDLVIGPPATFAPVNPVLYLAVSGDDVDRLHDLRTRVFAPPLERSLDHDFVPHVTLAEGIDGDGIADGLVALSSYRSSVTIERIDVLRLRPDRVWEPLADYPLARPAVVGRGGLPVELTVSERPDPAAARLLGSQPFTITARRDGHVLGLATGSTHQQTARLHELMVTEDERHAGVGARLLAAVESLAAERGCTSVTAPPHPFLERHGWVNGVRRT